MNEQHPIDEFFRQQLREHSYEPPMHLWDEIAARRQPPAPGTIPHFSLYKLVNLLSILILLSGSVYLWVEHIRSAHADPVPDGFDVVPHVSGPLAMYPPRIATSQSIPATSTGAPVDEVVLTGRAFSERVAPLPVHPGMAAVPSLAHREVPGIPAPAFPTAGSPSADQAVGGMATLPVRQSTLQAPPLTDDLTCAKFEERRVWRSTVDFMVSPDLVSRQLKAVSPQYEEYAAARNATETFRYGFSAGVRFSTISPQGLAVRSGLNYSQINEQFSYRNDQEERITITTEYGPNGQVIGTDTVVDYFSTRRIVNNRYTSVDIPLIFGYEFSPGSNLNVSLNGGTFINMLFTQQGEFLSPATFEPVQFSGNTPETYHAYRNRLGLAFYGSVGLTYRIREDLDLLLEPHIKWRPQTITAPGYVLEQRFFTSGLFLGLRKRV